MHQPDTLCPNLHHKIIRKSLFQFITLLFYILTFNQVHAQSPTPRIPVQVFYEQSIPFEDPDLPGGLRWSAFGYVGEEKTGEIDIVSQEGAPITFKEGGMLVKSTHLLRFPYSSSLRRT